MPSTKPTTESATTSPSKAPENKVEQQGAAPRPGPRRGAPGAKEVPAFKWKLMGRSGDMFLTLFKAVEREEVEAQLERLGKDSYYRDLRILDADTVVPQSPSVRAKIKQAIAQVKKPIKMSATKKTPPAKPKKAPKPTTAESTSPAKQPPKPKVRVKAKAKAAPTKSKTVKGRKQAKTPVRRALKKKA